MIDQPVRQTDPKKRIEVIQQPEWILVESLWNQLDAEQQTQLAQRLAELIQRMRITASQEKNSHERT